MRNGKSTRVIGQQGEDAAVAFLKRQGYRILKRNYVTKLGEIDVIARHGDTLCFVEVKYRGQNEFGAPQDALHQRKQSQIARAALAYLKTTGQTGIPCRFDVVAVTRDSDAAPPRIELMTDAFPLPGRWTL